MKLRIRLSPDAHVAGQVRKALDRNGDASDRRLRRVLSIYAVYPRPGCRFSRGRGHPLASAGVDKKNTQSPDAPDEPSLPDAVQEITGVGPATDATGQGAGTEGVNGECRNPAD